MLLFKRGAREQPSPLLEPRSLSVHQSINSNNDETCNQSRVAIEGDNASSRAL